MEPQEATCVIPDGHQVKVSHPTQPTTDDTGHSAVENSQTTSDVVQNKAPSKRSDATESATKDKSRPKSKKSTKHRQQRSKAVKNVMVAASDDDDDSSSSEEDDEEEDDGVSDNDSSTDSDSDEKKTRPRKKGSKKSSKISKTKKGNKKRTKHQSSKNVAKDSSSSSSDDSDGTDDTDAQDKKVKGRSSDNGELDQALVQQFRALQLQVSQLQQHMSQPNPQAALNTGFPNYGLNNVPFGGIGGFSSGLPGGLGGNVSGGLGGNLGVIANPGVDNSGLNSLPQIVPPPGPPRRRGRRGLQARLPSDLRDPNASDDQSSKNDKNEKGKPGSRPEFKRVDWVWDTTLYTFKLQDTAETINDSQYSEYIFHVRRTFDCENKYRETYVDIKSKLLRECLQDVIGNVQGISLVDETPKMDPNLLFLYLEDFRSHRKHLKKAEAAGDSTRDRKKNRKRLETKRKHLKVLIKYLDKDYAKIKESLYPMLDNGLITFDLLWALWKPNTLACTSTYGTTEEPRVFKVELAERQKSLMKGEFYYVEGKYFEFDGKKFGYGNFSEEIVDFHGARKISSLSCYPLKYHKDEAKLRTELIERGKKFVSLGGMHFKSYSGIAYVKRKRSSVVKFNVQQSRVMVDPAIFRRINPNYFVSMVRSHDSDIFGDASFSDDDSEGCGCDSSDGEADGGFVTKVYKAPDGKIYTRHLPRVNADQNVRTEKLDAVPPKEGHEDGEDAQANGDSTTEEKGIDTPPEFTDEDYLMASPVVLGFSFSEKQWLEFSVAGVKDIKWNDNAWDSLVLEPSTKDLIQALVKSRKFSASQTIDDVIQGKGKGLVTVLHGPPGTGKTLTAEGISELLKCPLYMVSAGELGTDSRMLESELQKILDICHAWGAILLLDEADVFLEKRDMHEIHRNALVSIFLRQLEYFQGILFLTTNRVETFDEAFQSRIHIALRYEALDAKAKKAIFKMFIERVRSHGKLELDNFTEEDYNNLAKRELNGREIKNVIGSAQDLAVNKEQPLGMRHIRQVLDVYAKFGRDLRGGNGYEDAMRSYF